MIRRDHAVLTALAIGGVLLTLFQNWYISLPLEDAARFDLCRITPTINCFKSLHAHGIEMLAFGLPVFPALLAIFVFQAGLCAFAWVAPAARSDAWLSLMRLASFPASGLAIFVLLNDWMVAKATSVSAVLVAGISLAVATLTVMHGIAKLRIVHAGWQAAGFALAGILVGFFLHGAGTSRRAYDDLMREQTAAMPSVAWPRFAHGVPRAGAAALGDVRAPYEILLIVDPAQEASRKLMREAAKLAPEYATRVRVTLYAAGEHGVDLVLAQQSGTVSSYLLDPKRQSGDRNAAREVVRRQAEAWAGQRAPAALTRNRKWGDSDFRLADVIRTIPE